MMTPAKREILRLRIQREEYLDQADIDSDNLALATLASILPWAAAGLLNFLIENFTWTFVASRCSNFVSYFNSRSDCSWVLAGNNLFAFLPVRALLSVSALWFFALFSAWVGLPAILFGVQLAQMRFYASIKARQIRLVELDEEVFELMKVIQISWHPPLVLGLLCLALPETERQDWWRQLLSVLAEVDEADYSAAVRSNIKCFPAHLAVARRSAKEKAAAAELDRG